MTEAERLLKRLHEEVAADPNYVIKVLQTKQEMVDARDRMQKLGGYEEDIAYIDCLLRLEADGRLKFAALAN